MKERKNAELGTFKALPALEFQDNLFSLDLPWTGVSLRLTRQGWIFHRIPEDCLLEKFPSFDASGKSFFLLSSMRKVVNLGNPSQLWNALQLGRSSQLRIASQKGNATQLGNTFFEKPWKTLNTFEKPWKHLKKLFQFLYFCPTVESFTTWSYKV